MTITKILIAMLQWIVGGPLLAFIGLPFLISSTNVLFQKNPSEQDKSDAWIAFVIGASSTACGGWLALDAWRKMGGQEVEDTTKFILELDSIFLEQIQSNQGNISCASFATAAKISLEVSHEYLQLKSVELDGTLTIDESGSTYYHFPL